MTGPPIRPRSGSHQARGLWLAAGACAAVGAVLFTPALTGPGDTEHRPPPAPPPAVTAPHPAPARTQPTLTPTSTPTIAATGSSPSGLNAAPTARPDLHDEPVPPAVPPLPEAAVRGHTDAHADPADEQQWRPVLTGFAHDFTHNDGGTAHWARRLSRWTTPQLAASYQHVDPREIPTGALVDLEATDVGAFTLTFTARYDTGLVLRGQAAYGPTSWRVTAVEPVKLAAAT